MDTVFAWGRLPSEFGICPPEKNLAMMTAYLDAKRIMDRTDDEIRKDEIEKERLKSKEQGKK